MQPTIRLFAALALAVALAACAAAPRALAPVPETLPADPADYPADAAFAAHALLARIQHQPTPHAAFSTQAAAALDDRDFHFPGFSLAAHRLLRYEADAPTSRQTTGSLVLQDRYGRIGALLYSTRYHLGGKTLTLDDAGAAPAYRNTVSVRAVLVPKAALPPLAETWEQTFQTLSALDAMPPEGLTSPHLLGTHALVLFVMERMHPDTDLNFNLPIPNVTFALPPITLTTNDYHDYDGWRVAIINTSPGLSAGLAP